MRIVVIQVGKTDKQFIRDGEEFYLKKIRRMTDLELITIPDIKNTRNMPVEERKSEESDRIEKQLKPGDIVLLLDEKGKEMNSRKFAAFMQNEMNLGIKRLVFIIGGPWGVSRKLKEKATSLLSLSAMTFSHQLVRLLFMEQLYRGFTILKGIPYHHD